VETKLRRNTRQRQTILDELCATKSHPTASELFQTVRRRLPRISLGTVYRNLDVLTASGQVMKLHEGNQEARFDGNPVPHAHAFCTCCERLSDVNLPAPELAQLEGLKVDGFLVTAHTVTLHGICASCLDSACVTRNQPR
jgi:Fe2+ or Zn2+ uptake regulation protein